MKPFLARAKKTNLATPRWFSFGEYTPGHFS
jgi:hypothetical protein